MGKKSVYSASFGAACCYSTCLTIFATVRVTVFVYGFSIISASAEKPLLVPSINSRAA